MKAIVHIGPPKTGSTSIQTMLWDNRTTLLDRGIAYDNYDEQRQPQSHYAYAVFHQRQEVPKGPAGYHLTDGTPEERTAYFDGVVQHLATWRDRFDTPLAVFSSEHFAPALRTPDLVRDCDAMFRKAFDEVEYVIYIRDPIAVYPSSYSEQLKSGAIAMPFDHFIVKRGARWSQLKMLDTWSDAVGSRLNVRLFEKAWWTGGSLLSDFCAVMGTTTDGLLLPEPVNEKLSAPLMRAIISLNRAHADETDFFRRVDTCRARAARLMELAPDGPPFEMNRKQIAAIEAQSDDEIEEIRQRFFPERDRLFTPRPFKAPPAVVEVERMARDALALLYRDAVTQNNDAPPTGGSDESNRRY